MSLYSVKVEKHVLAGLLKHPDALPDIDTYLTVEDFYNEVHQVIYSVIRSSVISGERVDKVLVSDKLSNLGITAKDEVNIFEYIDAISFIPVQRDAIVNLAKELIKYRIRREIFETANDIQSYVKSSGEDKVEDIVSKADSIYSNKILSYELDAAPENVFDRLESMVEERGENQTDETGLITPYPEFNRLFGGLRDANIYAVCSRPAQGKTTFINDICLGTGILNKIPVLVLDTEMSTEEIQFRMAAAQTGVPLWYVETGKWRNNQDMFDKVRNYFSNLKKHKYFHYHVRNKTIDEICSIIRRWHMKEVGRGNKCIIAYDYIKLTGEKVDKNWAEHQAIGEKIDKLKRISEELNVPIVTAMQMNRAGENQNRRSSTLTDDSSAIALSDRLQWFASFVSIFRRKTVDEIAMDGRQFGSHKLIPLKTRFQGNDAAGHQDIIRRPIIEETEGREIHSERLEYNYLNFEVDNFLVEDRGSLRDVVEATTQRFDIEEARVMGDGSTTI